MKRVLWSPIWLCSLALSMGCAGPPIPAPIEGEPVCPDVEIGAARTKMRGGLRFPVQLRILDGKVLVYRAVLKGLRTPTDKKSHTFIADDNREYTIEWAQCANERAPAAASSAARTAKEKDWDTASYECGNAVVYKTDKHTTRKGDKASHTLTFLAPPNTACWTGAIGATAAVADAGAPPPDAAAAPSDDAGALEDAGVAEAGAAPASADAGAVAPDAGAPAKPTDKKAK